MAKTKAKEKEKAREREERASGPRPHNDAYVMMLVVTFFAILAGSILMYLDFAGTKDLGIGEDPGYGNRNAPKETITAPPKLGDAPKTDTPTPPAGTPPGGGTPMGTPMDM
jgi:hypothetical protein